MRRPRGFALIAALFVVLLLGILGVTLAGLYSTTVKTAVEAWKGLRALAVADSGLRWVFQQEFADDLDFSDNVSPTDPPFGANGINLLTQGKFWVEYGPTKTQREVDLTVTARVQDVVRVVKTQLRVKAAKPLRKAIYASGSINLSGTAALSTITGDVETESVTPIITGNTSVTGTKLRSSPYRRFQGVDLAPFAANADNSVTGELILTAASYGDAVNGYIWYVSGAGNRIVLRGPGTITINGTIVTTSGGQLTVEGDLSGVFPTVVWTARAKVIDGVSRMLPALVGDSVNLPGKSNVMQITGLVCSRVGAFQWSPQAGSAGSSSYNFTLNGLLLAKGDVLAMPGPGGETVKLTMTYDSNWNIPWGLEVPWLMIQGPKVEYEFAQWREQVSP